MVAKEIVGLREEAEKVLQVLLLLQRHHPDRLQCIRSENCWEVLTRFGVDSAVAACAATVMEAIEIDGNIVEPGCFSCLLTSVLADVDLSEATPVVRPGEKDEKGIYTHSNVYFTEVNRKAKRYGIEADANLSPDRGPRYYQAWRNAEEIIQKGAMVLSCWDAQAGRMGSPLTKLVATLATAIEGPQIS